MLGSTAGFLGFYLPRTRFFLVVASSAVIFVDFLFLFRPGTATDRLFLHLALCLVLNGLQDGILQREAVACLSVACQLELLRLVIFLHHLKLGYYIRLVRNSALKERALQ